jgi:hypothetical protein
MKFRQPAFVTIPWILWPNSKFSFLHILKTSILHTSFPRAQLFAVLSECKMCDFHLVKWCLQVRSSKISNVIRNEISSEMWIDHQNVIFQQNVWFDAVEKTSVIIIQSIITSWRTMFCGPNASIFSKCDVLNRSICSLNSFDPMKFYLETCAVQNAKALWHSSLVANSLHFLNFNTV